MTKTDRSGWLGSLLAHFLIALFLFFWTVDASKTEPEFIEVSLGSIATVPIPRRTSFPKPASAPHREASDERQFPVNLPKRTPGLIEEDPPLSPTRKSVQEGRYLPRTTELTDPGIRTDEGREDQVERGLTDSIFNATGRVTGPIVSRNAGTDAGNSVAYSMQWGEGGNRRLLKGDLPAYPEGVNVETQIKLQAYVMPDGRIRTLRPIQKGNPKLEQAAMEKVKLWAFEPLDAKSPHDQSCVITFNFVLR